MFGFWFDVSDSFILDVSRALVKVPEKKSSKESEGISRRLAILHKCFLSMRKLQEERSGPYSVLEQGFWVSSLKVDHQLEESRTEIVAYEDLLEHTMKH
jgi:hypothetical protein